VADNFTNYGRYLLATGDGEPSGELDWLADDIYVALINQSLYAFDVTDKYFSDIPSNAVVATYGPLTGKFTTTNGACGAANVTIPVLTGPPVSALVLFKMVDNDPTKSPFIMWIDSYFSGSIAIPAGGDFNIIWPTDSNHIFRI